MFISQYIRVSQTQRVNGKRVDFGPRGLKRQVVLDSLPKTDDCVICRNCSKHEADLVEKLKARESSSLAARAQRGSAVSIDFEGLFAIRHKEDVRSASSETMSGEKAFALLAPSVSINSKTPIRIITTSAGRLHLVLNTIKEKLESGFLSDSQIEYLSPKQFENFLIQCGLHWIPRDHVSILFEAFDANKSGNLHVSEVLFVAEKAHALCRKILCGHVTDFPALSRELVIGNPYSSSEFLTHQLSRIS